jgi:hypothetical protein
LEEQHKNLKKIIYEIQKHQLKCVQLAMLNNC